ncbi:hypothetical protein HMPREF9148_01541, partial [Prevotella sp. F0091]
FLRVGDFSLMIIYRSPLSSLSADRLQKDFTKVVNLIFKN